MRAHHLLIVILAIGGLVASFYLLPRPEERAAMYLRDGNSAAAIEVLRNSDAEQVIVLQVTFTDAQTVVALAEACEQPLAIWAVPEPRLGGRLRLNAFCGLNLASHALSLRGRAFSPA